nr:DNA adenine methylase [Ktedonobacterales bacterium]
MVSAPFPWFGGKRRLAPWIIPHFPAHTTYVEVFGGSAAVLFAKPPSALEIYNDLDGELVHFFRVLRDPVLAMDLSERLAWTPYSREEWRTCLTQLRAGEEVDDVERARRWFVAVAQSFSSNVTSGSWRHSVGPGGH